MQKIGHQKHEKTQNLIENASHRFERITSLAGDEFWRFGSKAFLQKTVLLG
jgi:hypothetical protein